MRPQPAAVLHHATGRGDHYDWLLGDPARPRGRLWTARVPLPPWFWARVSRFVVEVAPPHRRLYLRYQGPLGRGRGRVARVDAGAAWIRLWSRDRIELLLWLGRAGGRVRLRRVGACRWLATCDPIEPAASRGCP